MSINFPQNPSVNDQYTESGITYIWNGDYWGKLEVTNQALSGLVAKIDVESNFPASLDSGLADPISELQAKVGVDGSAVTTSLDYKVAVVSTAGIVSAFAGTVAPTGWLMCNGSEVSRSTYADLFAAVGTTYGAGNGTTTFNLPDLRTKVIVGSGSGVNVADEFGSASVTLSTNQIPAHNHAFAPGSNHVIGSAQDPGTTTSTTTVGNHNHGLATGASTTFNYFAPSQTAYCTSAASGNVAAIAVGRVSTTYAGSFNSGSVTATTDVRHNHTTGARQFDVYGSTTAATANNATTGQTLSLHQPSIVLNYIIKI